MEDDFLPKHRVKATCKFVLWVLLLVSIIGIIFFKFFPLIGEISNNMAGKL